MGLACPSRAASIVSRDHGKGLYLFNKRSQYRTSTKILSFLRLVKPKVFAFQKGGVPAAPSGTATLLRLSPSYQYYPRTLLAVAYFRYSRLPWLDGRCVQGPGTYSPRHG